MKLIDSIAVNAPAETVWAFLVNPKNLPLWNPKVNAYHLDPFPLPDRAIVTLLPTRCYSPSNPKETVLEARSSWNTMNTLLGLGIGFLLLPVLLWLFRRQLEPERYK